MSTLKEIKGSLKQAGFKKEDIKAVLRLLPYLGALDELVFPESPITIGFSTSKNRFEHFAGYHPGKNAEVKYSIFVNGLAGRLQEEKERRGLWVPDIKTKPGHKKQSKLLKPTWEELLVPMAAHEVRHRVQNECLCKKFSPLKSAKLIKDDLLRAIVIFEGYVLEENEKTWTKENKPKAFIKERMERTEFDASVIERLVAVKIHGKNAYSLREEIVSIIKMSAP
ncbi:MAG: hypothetical protein ABIG29_01480 [Candidatus Nealsonbacteria bacterium]